MFEHVVLLQNSGKNDRDLIDVIGNANYNLNLMRINSVISLAEARNKMISFSNEKNLVSESDFISFPDDDCWFPSLYWDRFLDLFIKNKFDLFYSKYSPEPVILSESSNTHNVSKLIRESSSITTFYSSDVFTKIGLFDENFGVGAKNNGGEDTDFAIRGALIAKLSYFSNNALVGHKSPLAENKPLYFRGALGVLSKHKFKGSSLFFNYLRKLLIGGVYLATGKLTFSEFKIAK
ncbi:MAG: hypothetical protein JKY50_18995 [Oleispira sp.]|nr:hypothetical protein [Oleispira sp.]